MNSEIQLTSLADELLVAIFRLLPSCDLHNVINTCKRFQNLCCEKAIVRHLNFERCYLLRENILKEILRPSSLCKNVQILNLNCCYWIPATGFKPISKLRNLKELHILECRVSFQLLQTIIKPPMQLNALSWTWPKRNKDASWETKNEQSAQEAFLHLRRLTLQLTNGFQLQQLVALLKFCSLLEELNIKNRRLCTSQEGLMTIFPKFQDVKNVKLPHLRSLSMEISPLNCGVCIEHFAKDILRACDNGVAWNHFWISDGGSNVLVQMMNEKRMNVNDIANSKSVSLSNSYLFPIRIARPEARNDWKPNFLPNLLSDVANLKCDKLSLDSHILSNEILQTIGNKCSNLKSLNMVRCTLRNSTGFDKNVAGLSSLFDCCSKITHLDLRMTCIHWDSNPLEIFANLKGLKSLSILACLVARTSKNEPISVNNSEISQNNTFADKTRSGISTIMNDENIKKSHLWILTENCSQLESLEISGPINKTLVNCINRCNLVNDQDLVCISRWKKLEYLSLTDLSGINRGEFLNSISKCCPLNRIKIKQLGSSAGCTYFGSLVQAIPSWNMLRDFSLFQKNLNLERLFSALQNSKNLERICISDNSDINQLKREQTINLVSKLPNLVVLYLVVPVTAELSKSIHSLLLKQFLFQRPALDVLISCPRKCLSDLVFLDSCPTVHLDELFII